VHFWADGPPGSVRISGGSTVAGPWTKAPPANGSSAGGDFDVYMADVSSINPNGTQDRHLYVDRVRMNRTVLSKAAIGQLFAGAKSDNSSFIVSGAGAKMATAWPVNRGAAGRGVEFVWLGGKAQWTEPRCAGAKSVLF
jgi:hypothetical protein